MMQQGQRVRVGGSGVNALPLKTTRSKRVLVVQCASLKSTGTILRSALAGVAGLAGMLWSSEASALSLTEAQNQAAKNFADIVQNRTGKPLPTLSESPTYVGNVRVLGPQEAAEEAIAQLREQLQDLTEQLALEQQESSRLAAEVEVKAATSNQVSDLLKQLEAEQKRAQALQSAQAELQQQKEAAERAFAEASAALAVPAPKNVFGDLVSGGKQLQNGLALVGAGGLAFVSGLAYSRLKDDEPAPASSIDAEWAAKVASLKAEFKAGAALDAMDEDTLRRKTEELRMKIQEVRASNSRVAKNTANDIESLTIQLSSAADALRVAREAAEAKIGDLNFELRAAYKKLKELEGQKKKAVNMSDEMQLAYKRDVMAARGKITKLEAALQAQGATLKASTAEVETLQVFKAQAAELNFDLTQARRKLKELESQKAKAVNLSNEFQLAYKKDVMAARAKIQGLEAEARAQHVAMTAFSAELDALRANKYELMAARKKLKELESQKTKAVAMSNELQLAYKKDVMSARAKTAAVQDEMKQQQQTLAAFSAELDALRITKYELMQARKRLKDLESYKVKASALNEELTQAYKKDVMAARAKTAATENELKQTQQAMATLVSEADALRVFKYELMAARKKLKELESQKSKAVGMSNELQLAYKKDVMAARAKIGSLQGDIAALNVTLQATVAEVEALRVSKYELMQARKKLKELETVKAKMLGLNEELNQAYKKDVMAARAKIQKLEGELQTSNVEVKALRESKYELMQARNRLKELTAFKAKATVQSEELQQAYKKDVMTARRHIQSLQGDLQAQAITLQATNAEVDALRISKYELIQARKKLKELETSRAKAANMSEEFQLAYKKDVMAARSKIMKLENELQTSTKEVIALRESKYELMQARKKLKELESFKVKATAQNNELHAVYKKDVMAARQKIMALESEVKTTTSEVIALRESKYQLMQARKQLKALEAYKAKTMHQSEEMQQTYKRDVMTARRRIQSLEAELTGTTKEVLSLRESKYELMAARRKLKELEAFKHKAVGQSAELQLAYKNDVMAARRRINSLEGEVHTLSSNMEASSIEIEALRVSKYELMQARRKLKELDAQKGKAVTLSEEYQQAYKKDVMAARRKIQNLETEVQAYTSEVVALRAVKVQAGELNYELNVARRKLKELDATKHKLTGMSEELQLAYKKDVMAARSRIFALESEVTKQRTVMAAFEAEVEALRRAKADAGIVSVQLMQAKKKLRDLEAYKTRAAGQSEVLQQAYKKDVMAARSRITNLQGEMQAVQTKLQVAEATAAAASHESERVQEQLSGILARAEAAQQTVAKTIADLSNEKAARRQAESNLQLLKTEYEAILQQAESLKKNKKKTTTTSSTPAPATPAKALPLVSISDLPMKVDPMASVDITAEFDALVATRPDLQQTVKASVAAASKSSLASVDEVPAAPKRTRRAAAPRTPAAPAAEVTPSPVAKAARAAVEAVTAQAAQPPRVPRVRRTTGTARKSTTNADLEKAFARS